MSRTQREGFPEPPLAGDEVATLLGSLERQRATFAWKSGGLGEAGLNAKVGASSVTLGGLLKHLAFMEDLNFSKVLLGRDLGQPWSNMDRDLDGWDWRTTGDTAEQLHTLWRDAVDRSRAAIAEALATGGLDQPVRDEVPDTDEQPTMRRVLIDMIEEYARHVGHADLIRESVDGLVGEDPPGGPYPYSPGLVVTDVAGGESTVGGVGIPATGTASRALEVATAFYPPPLLNHCLRSYLWGAWWGATHGVAFDAELLYVASLLHDLGMTRSFDSHHVAFEKAGGDVAWVFLTGAGWPVERRDRVRDVVARHLREDADPETDSEAHLLQVAVTFDVTGHRVDTFPGSLRSQVLDRYPRLGFGKEFLALCTAQAERKPGSAMAELIRGGIAHRITGNPLDR